MQKRIKVVPERKPEENLKMLARALVSLAERKVSQSRADAENEAKAASTTDT